MFKTLAIVLVAILLLVVCQTQIKGLIVERQLRLSISSLELSAGSTDRLLALASRIRRGYVEQRYTEVERNTLLGLRGELKELVERKERTQPRVQEAEAQRIAGKLEAILKRHGL
ncbi:MAG: hypothetical protein MPN21_09350 [Thermoanaerobaculia bacterium]|nr:hypothetical protein [Thermoanaerobaculia bacterium]